MKRQSKQDKRKEEAHSATQVSDGTTVDLGKRAKKDSKNGGGEPKLSID